MRFTLLLAVALACLACGSKQDFSGDNELAKTQTPSGKQAVSATNGATVHKAMMLPPPRQQHP